MKSINLTEEQLASAKKVLDGLGVGSNASCPRLQALARKINRDKFTVSLSKKAPELVA